MKLECVYCGRKGEYPSVIEIRSDKLVCVDRDACDKRDIAAQIRQERELEG